MFSRIIRTVSIVFVPVLLSACGAGTVGEATVKAGVADAPGVISGQVIDVATRQPIANATVSLVVKGEVRTSVTGNDANANLFGRFFIDQVPAGTHRLKIGADSYAQNEYEVSIEPNDTNTVFNIELGALAIGKPFSVKTKVLVDGNISTGTTVYAKATSAADACIATKSIDASRVTMQSGYPRADEFRYSSSESVISEKRAVLSGPLAEVSAVTDLSGLATINGLSRCWEYTLVTPNQDADGDGVIDLITANRYSVRANSPSNVYEVNLYTVEKGAFDLTVHVSAEAKALAGVAVILTPYTSSDRCLASPVIYSGSTSSVTKKSDEKGSVVFSGLNICTSYEINAKPFDSDADGIPDFRLRTSTHINNESSYSKNIALALMPIEFNENISIVGTSVDKNKRIDIATDNYTLGRNSYEGPMRRYLRVAAAKKSDAIKLVFNVPVEIDTAVPVNVAYYNSLTDPDKNDDGVRDADFGNWVVSEATAELDETKMILTVTPAEPLPMNQVVSIRGAVTNAYRVDPYMFETEIYIDNDSETGLSKDTVAIDDYFNTDAASYYNSYVSPEVSLTFTEWVDGTYEIISVTKTSTGETLAINASPRSISQWANLVLVYSDGKCRGCARKEGVFYRVPLQGVNSSPYPFPDRYSTVEGDKVTVRVNVHDATGNTINEVLTLTVQ